MAKVVLSLVGKQGSGKSTIGRKLAVYLGTKHFETSDVVRELYKGKKRVELPETGHRTREEPDWLASPIFDKIAPVYEKGKQTVVLTGVREIEIHHYLRKKGLFVLGVDVRAEPDVRLRRLIDLGKVKSTREFIEHDLRERALGINEVQDAAKIEMHTKDTTDPDKLVRALVSQITKEGTRLRE